MQDEEYAKAVTDVRNAILKHFAISWYLDPDGLGDATFITGRITGHIIKRDGAWREWGPWYFDEAELTATLDAAFYKNALADKVARSLYLSAHSLKLEVPQALAEFIDCALVSPPIKAATTANLDKPMRDALVIDAIKWLKNNSRLPYTRNDASDPHSCCDAIAAAFHGERHSLSLSYEYLKKQIWAKRDAISFRPSILWDTLPA